MKNEPYGKKKPTKKHSPPKNIPPGTTHIPKKSKNLKSFSSLAGLIIILLLGILIYSNSFECSFQFDDFHTIVNNSTIRDITDVSVIWKSSPNRPVAFLTFAVNYHFNQLDVRYWHYVNLIIHLMNAIVVWWFTMLILSSPVMKDQQIARHKKLISFFTALLFVSHPLATQSVTYIVQRMTSLVALFYFLSLALYMSGRLTTKGWISRILLFSGSFFSAVLAMRTKENAFTLPLAILLIEFFFLHVKRPAINFRDYRVLLLIVLFLGVILIIPLNHSFEILKPVSPTGHPDIVLTPYSYFLTQFKVVVKYIQLLFIPVNLNLDYDFPVSTSLFQIKTLLSFLFLSALIIIAIFLFKKHRIISFGIFWFFLTLSVESGIVPLYDLIVEHRTYLPSFGFFLIFISVLYIFLWDKYRSIAIAAVVVVTGIYSWLAYERNKVWKDDLTLWTDVVSKSPAKSRAITNLGIAYANRGQWDRAVEVYSTALKIDSLTPLTLISRGYAYRNTGQYDKALVDYNNAIRIDPASAMAFCNRGVCYFNLGQREKAIEDFTKAIELDSRLTEAWSDRSAAYLETGQLDKAKEDIDIAITLQPEYYQAYSNRGAIYERLNQSEEAISDYTRAIELNPGFYKALINRASVYARTGQSGKATEDYKRAIEIDPQNVQAYFDRGVMYANLGQREKAVEDYTRVIELDPGNKLAYYNRGLTYGRMGKLEQAIADFTTALKIDPDFTSASKNREIAVQRLRMVKW